MGNDSKKKAAVVAITVLMVAMLAVETACYVVFGSKPLIVVAIAVNAVLAAAMIWYARERLGEIKEGSDDDVDNY